MHESGIFKAAVKLASDQRAKYLDQACGSNQELRREIDLLLQAHENSESFLEASPAAVATIERQTSERVGQRIGRYRLLEQIGEGGMGNVWVAEQTEPVKRRVALKFIKPGMDSRQVISRFDAERQALALMDHPNIAKVFDGGMTDEGRPFFVMEYVKGMPITEFCNRHRLSIADRLKLVVPVCQAVQHAHHKGVIHRDLKPSNILVCLYDGQAVPKVIDFGLAKAMHQPLTEHTLYTAHGLMVGTPLYMSPEQAEFNNLDVDTRTDIYSLGVILYELLTGTTPLQKQQFKDAAFQEVLRLIKEVEPQRPSLKISTSLTLPSIAAQRNLEPAQLCRTVRGDLDWIVMKSLEKDRSRRYETANGLARDIERHLRNEPVDASPPSAAYKLKKFVIRNRSAALAVAAVATALLLGLAVATWQAVIATRATAVARSERDEKEHARQDEQVARREAELARNKAEAFVEDLKTANLLLNGAMFHRDRANWASAHADFTKAAELCPNHAYIWIWRSELYTRLGLWELAADDVTKAFELQEYFKASLIPQDNTYHWRWFRHALLCSYARNEKNYAQICSTIAERLDDAADQEVALDLLRGFFLVPTPAMNSADLADRAEKALSLEPRKQWYYYVAGTANHRAGRFELAAQRLQESLRVDPNWNARAINYPVLAMAHYRLGQVDEARRALASAETTMDRWVDAMLKGPVGFMPVAWWDWLECQIYYREAKLLITGSPPPLDPRLMTIQERSLAAIQR